MQTATRERAEASPAKDAVRRSIRLADDSVVPNGYLEALRAAKRYNASQGHYKASAKMAVAVTFRGGRNRVWLQAYAKKMGEFVAIFPVHEDPLVYHADELAFFQQMRHVVTEEIK